MALLEITDLRTEIQLKDGVVHAVDGVTLHVDEGETLGVVGESGCGKTMTALTIMQLLPNGGHIAGGSIKLGGRELTGLKPEDMRKIRGDDIGMIFQDPLSSLNPTLTVGRQIAEAVLLHREVSHKEALDRAVEVLDLVGLPRARERVSEYPHQFSGGMRQRVMIAMALACDPKLLIADEPTTALDVTIQKQILELIDDLRRRLGMAVIMVTHDLGVIAGRADRVAVMYAGKVVETTETSSLYANPRHPYTEALFHALPEKSAETRERLYSIPGAPPDLVNPPKGCRFAPRCRYATDKCRTEAPELSGETTAHAYACFFPVGGRRRRRWPATSPWSAARPTDAPRTAWLEERPRRHVVLEAKDLVKDFPVTAGGVLRRATSVLVSGRSRTCELPRSPGEGETFGLVGESGCGKTTIGRMHRRPGEGRPAARSASAARTSTTLQAAGSTAASAADIQLHVPGLLRVARPAHAGRVDPPRAAGRAGHRRRAASSSQACQRDARRGRPARVVDRALPARVLRRPAAAARLRPRAAAQPAADRRRRAGVRARRLDPGAGAEPDAATCSASTGLTYLFISHDLSVVRYLVQPRSA